MLANFEHFHILFRFVFQNAARVVLVKKPAAEQMNPSSSTRPWLARNEPRHCPERAPTADANGTRPEHTPRGPTKHRFFNKSLLVIITHAVINNSTSLITHTTKDTGAANKKQPIKTGLMKGRKTRLELSPGPNYLFLKHYRYYY
jgi:hypothetical protein